MSSEMILQTNELPEQLVKCLPPSNAPSLPCRTFSSANLALPPPPNKSCLFSFFFPLSPDFFTPTPSTNIFSEKTDVESTHSSNLSNFQHHQQHQASSSSTGGSVVIPPDALYAATSEVKKKKQTQQNQQNEALFNESKVRKRKQVTTTAAAATRRPPEASLFLPNSPPPPLPLYQWV